MKRYHAIAEYYDAEYTAKDLLAHDVPFFLDHLPKRRQDVLELAVGTGRAAIPIAQAGHRVVGNDFAPDMLAIARRKRDAVGLGDRELELIHADALKLNLRRKFDWIAIFFNTFLAFTTLEEQDALLTVVRRHLKPKGRFWVDIFNPNMAILAHDAMHNLDPTLFHVPRFDRTVYKTTDIRRDEKRVQVQHVTFNYRWYDARSMERRERIRFDMTYIFPRELVILMERNGLKVEQVYGNYDGSPMTRSSPRMIARCCHA